MIRRFFLVGIANAIVTIGLALLIVFLMSRNSASLKDFITLRIALVIQLWLLPSSCIVAIAGTSSSTWRVPTASCLISAVIGAGMYLWATSEPVTADGAPAVVEGLMIIALITIVACLFNWPVWLLTRARDRKRTKSVT